MDERLPEITLPIPPEPPDYKKGETGFEIGTRLRQEELVKLKSELGTISLDEQPYEWCVVEEQIEKVQLELWQLSRRHNLGLIK